MKLVKNIYDVPFNPAPVWKNGEAVLCQIPANSIIKAIHFDRIELEQDLRTNKSGENE